MRLGSFDPISAPTYTIPREIVIPFTSTLCPEGIQRIGEFANLFGADGIVKPLGRRSYEPIWWEIKSEVYFDKELSD
jgi:hypothetical protein